MTESLPTSAEQMQDILDIEGIITSPWADYLRSALWGLLAVVLLSCLAALVYYLFKWWQARRDERNLSPAQKAKRALLVLAAAGHLPSAHFAEFYFYLTEIFKTYLETAFRPGTLEKTDADLKAEAEVIAAIAGMPAPALREFLSRAELAKFAKQKFLVAEGEADLSWVRTFVEASNRQAESLTSQKEKK